jgi:hypothetical protein
VTEPASSGTVFCQPLEAAIDLEHAGVIGQHLAGADPVLGIDVRRRQVALPGAVIPGER